MSTNSPADVQEPCPFAAEKVLMKAGDVVEVLVADEEDGHESMQFAVVNTVEPNNTLSVQYIEPVGNDDEGIFVLDENCNTVERCSLNGHWSIDDTSAESLNAGFAKIGLQVIQNDAGITRFELLDDIDFSSDSDDDDDDLSDFIVPDDHPDCEPFSKAPETNDFVRDTHAAVREFGQWAPTDASSRNMKEYLDGLSSRAAFANEDRRFARGQSPIPDYECRT